MQNHLILTHRLTHLFKRHKALHTNKPGEGGLGRSRSDIVVKYNSYCNCRLVDGLLGRLSCCELTSQSQLIAWSICNLGNSNKFWIRTLEVVGMFALRRSRWSKQKELIILNFFLSKKTSSICSIFLNFVSFKSMVNLFQNIDFNLYRTFIL